MRIWPEKTQDQEFNELGSRGFKGSLNDRQYAYLLAAGYKGALADMSTSYRAYSPKLLFASSEVGVWYDFDDVANLDWRRNLLTYSEQFDNAAWSRVGLNVSANAAASPTGSVTADKLVEDTSTGVHITFAANALAQTSTISLYVKAAERSIIGVGNSSDAQFAQFDLSNGTVISAGSGTISGGAITPAGGGWYRISCLFTFGGVNKSLGFTLYQSSGVRSYTGDGTSGILIWGAQLEIGSVATEYQRITDANTEVRERFPNATLYQDSAGTIPVTAVGQPVGLRLDKSKGLVLGPELVTNGDFSDGLTGWTSGSAISSSTVSGEVQITFGGSAGVSANNWFFQAGVLPSTTASYRVTFDATWVSGGVLQVSSGFDIQATISANAGKTSYSVVVRRGTAGSAANQQSFVFAGAAGAVWRIDNISVKELPGFHAAQSTPGSRAIYASVPKGGRRNLLTYSEQFDNAAWKKQAFGVASAPVFVSSTITAPDGTNTAWAYTFNTNAGTTSSDASRLVNDRSETLLTTRTQTVWMKVASGTAVVELSDPGSAASTVAANLTTSWQRITSVGANTVVTSGLAITTRGNTAPGSVQVHIWHPQSELGSTATNYQRVGSIYDITEAGVQTLYGLLYDGLDDFYVTPTITPGTDKVQVFAGVRKLSDAAAGVLLEFSSDWNGNNGTFLLAAPSAAGTGNYSSGARGTIPVNANQIAGMSASAPDTSVISSTHDIAADLSTIRRNGVAGVSATGDKGTGNFLAYPLYMGRRGGTAFPYNGYEFGLIVRFGANLSEQRIKNTENWLNERTRGY